MQTSPSERWGEGGKFGFVVIVIIFSSSYSSCFSRIFCRNHLSSNLSSSWLNSICVPSLWALPLVVVDDPSSRSPCPSARPPHIGLSHVSQSTGIWWRVSHKNSTRKQLNRFVTEQEIDIQGLLISLYLLSVLVTLHLLRSPMTTRYHEESDRLIN